jgi:hypothetical protein
MAKAKAPLNRCEMNKPRNYFMRSFSRVLRDTQDALPLYFQVAYVCTQCLRLKYCDHII